MSGEERDPLLDDLRHRIEIRTAEGPEVVVPPEMLKSLSLLTEPQRAVIEAATAWFWWLTSKPSRVYGASEIEEALYMAVGKLNPEPPVD